MAKQIKVIKCPQCGNSKPTAIGKEHYRCGKCDTEFFLDNDDVNINVNHRYEQRTAVRPASSSSGLSVIFGVIFVVLLVLTAGITFVTKQIRKASKNITTSSVVSAKSDMVFSVLLNVDGQAFAFYLEDENTLLSNNGYTAAFYDIVDGKKVKIQEKLMANEKINKVECRKFQSDGACYVVINNRFLYKVDANAFTDMAEEISARKPALNSGYSKIFLVPEEVGEGFSITTNLGKDFYYFPASDALYTEKALNYIIRGKMETVSPEATDRVYYLFRNKESKQSSNVAELLEITYKYNNGGPENKLLRIDGSELNRPGDYRILSHKPLTEERICFSPEVLYYDKENILITYKETLADNSKANIQLLDIKGAVVWTVPLEKAIENIHTVKTNRGFMLQNKNSLLEISMDGKTTQSYKLP